MKVGIIGTGYVGLVTSVCFASLGHTVVALDKRKDIIEKLSQGTPTIYEEDLENILVDGLRTKKLKFTCNITDLKDCEALFLAVGTPSLPNGHADLSQVYDAVQEVLKVVDDSVLITLRSTIPIGTMNTIQKLLDNANRSNPLGFCPEFLREGVAISDFLHPHKIVLASNSSQGQELLQNVYNPLIEKSKAPVIMCNTFETAELIKYSANAFLATKVTFINQIAQLAQHANADIYKISQAMGLDPRISPFFLEPGPGYGGSCFPKDTIALTKCGLTYGVDMSLIEEVHRTNIEHQEFISSWILNTLANKGIHGNTHSPSSYLPTIAIWGLTFKANTDDVRDSASLTIIKNIVEAGFSVKGYDPKGKQNFLKNITSTSITITDTAMEAVKDASALVVLTEWKEFSNISAEHVLSQMKIPTCL